MIERVQTRWRCALVVWLAGYPLMTMLVLVLEPVLAGWPVPLRTLLFTTVMAPTMVFWLVPLLSERTSSLAAGRSQCGTAAKFDSD